MQFWQPQFVDVRSVDFFEYYIDPVRGRMGKLIILLLDGTWNDSEAGDADTNIVRLRELILGSLDQPTVGRAAPEAPKDDCAVKTTERTYSFENGKTNEKRAVVLYYDRGVGTGGFFDKYLGGALGVGLERNVRRAYRFLADMYRPDDQIFILGFSRGAYTARSLVGFIAVAGLLRFDVCSPLNESRAWHYYRANPKDRFRSAYEASGLTHEAPKALIECVAVFDTVGARGIPIRWFWRENRDLFEFHDVELSTVVKRNFQALAIDEHRESFQAAIWREPTNHSAASETEQVWFVGSHADIGGGYINEFERVSMSGDGSTARRKAFDDITLDWMVKKLKLRYPGFPIRNAMPFGRNLDRGWALESKRHESRQWFYRLFPFAWRSIGNSFERFSRCSRQKYVCQNRHARTINERVHISALERFGKRVREGISYSVYMPRNLRLAIEKIDRSYSSASNRSESADLFQPLLVVNWSGDVLNPQNQKDRELVRSLIDPHLLTSGQARLAKIGADEC